MSYLDQNVGVRLYTLLFPIGVFLGFLFSKELNISESMLKSILGHLIIFSFILFEISLNRSYDYQILYNIYNHVFNNDYIYFYAYERF